MNKQKTNFYNENISIQQKNNFLKYLSPNYLDEKFCNENKEFKIILSQLNQIYKLLHPVLNKLEINFDLYLVGGCLRDHILDNSNKIKDLDLVIEFNDNLRLDKIKINEYDKNDFYLLINQKKEILKFIQKYKHIINEYELKICENQSREKILHEIVSQVMKKFSNFNIKEFFLESQEVEKKDKEKKSLSSDNNDNVNYSGLFSVIKLNSNNLSYPIDLLLNNNVDTYLTSFDFEICKCRYIYRPNQKNNSKSLVLDEGFIKDVINSTLTINAGIFYTKSDVDRSLSNHYIRLLKKYPEYKTCIINNNSENNNLSKYIITSQQYNYLNYKLPKIQESTVQNVKKIKI